MPAEYITLQLTHFKAGIRANPVMQGMAATLSPEDMKPLGVYFSQQKPKGQAAKDAALRARQGRSSIAAATRRPAFRRAPPAIRPTAPACRRTIRASPASIPITRTRS